ncbi:hypothetical protein ACWFR5_31045 [Streptomyces sp. NPDC055092]
MAAQNVLAGCPGVRAQRILAPLMPPQGHFPDFLTPEAASGGLEFGIDAVLSTPRLRLRSEVTLLSGRIPRRREPARTSSSRT